MKNKFYIMTALVISLTGCSNIEDGTQPTGNVSRILYYFIQNCADMN